MPSPAITPVAASETQLMCRNSSRRWMLVIWTSITGRSTASSASISALEGRGEPAGWRGLPGGGARVRARARVGGVAGGVDDDAGGPAAALLHPVDQLALGVGLSEINGEAERLRSFGAEGLQVVQRRGAVLLRLAQSEHVDVRPVQHGDEGRGHGVLSVPAEGAARITGAPAGASAVSLLPAWAGR